ncbi:MAG: 4Fe-4S dicluster domain-containing protein [Defluviitaleaceae bacterium]|nr:4Fe-4S dicluster domain-containing protein [Defluviitaleaceae bacterium]
MIHRFIFKVAADGIKKAILVPKVDYERCVNRKQKWTQCTTCQDACPRGAITYNKLAKGSQIKIDESICRGCHICHGVCPTGCILQPESFIKSNDQLEYDFLMVSCRKRGGDFAGVNIPCIASLPWEFYAYSSYNAPISIMTGECEGCEMGAIEHVEAIRRRLKLFWGEAYDEKILSHGEAPTAQYSRREMFGIFSRRARESKAPADVLLPETVKVFHPSVYRNLLLNELDKNKTHGWLTWEIEDAPCNACRVCEVLCPSSAIFLTDEKELAHDPQHCNSCRICKYACTGKRFMEQVTYTKK